MADWVFDIYAPVARNKQPAKGEMVLVDSTIVNRNPIDETVTVTFYFYRGLYSARGQLLLDQTGGWTEHMDAGQALTFTGGHIEDGSANCYDVWVTITIQGYLAAAHYQDNVWYYSATPPLAITTTSLPDGGINVAYSQTLQATGGAGGYKWAITAGTLPPGLSLDPATGVISGTPTTAGTTNFNVSVTSGSVTAMTALSITISAVPPPPVEPTPPSTTWPLGLEIVHQFLQSFWNQIQAWFDDAKQWLYINLGAKFLDILGWIQTEVAKVGPWIHAEVLAVYDWITTAVGNIITGVSTLFHQVWDWIQDAITRIDAYIQPFFAQIWDWIRTSFDTISTMILAHFNTLSATLTQFASDVTTKVSQINTWFSNEFIDPFLDWLLKFPGNMTAALDTLLTGIGKRIETWLTHKSPGFPQVIKSWWDYVTGTLYNLSAWCTGYNPPYSIDQSRTFWALLGLGLGSAFTSLTQALPNMLAVLTPALQSVFAWFGNIGIWIQLYAGAIGSWFASILPRIAGWFASQWIPVLTSSAILGLEATGKLETIIGNIATPAIERVFDWAEGMGPVSPQAGKQVGVGLTKLATFTVAGLAGMTLAGEALSPLKHIGLGHISAVIYDLINYKTLTAAFMGVLAACYIKTPLTYYYNKAARPNLPNERSMMSLFGEYFVTEAQFEENMAYHGFSDEWINIMKPMAYRALTPRMLNYLAATGITDDALIDRELKHSAFDPRTIPYVKTWLQRVASGDLKVMFASTAMTRFREGMDDEAALSDNLTTLGVAPELLPKYVFGAQLSYLYDYQHDLIAYYVDAYHRRDIEEPELRSSLVSAGLSPERLDLVVQAQSIKRLAAPKAADDPAVAVQVDTIRDKRSKNLITHDEEVRQLVALGKELPYASAIADNDDVKLTEKIPIVPVPPIPFYETDTGKIRRDTIRWQRRKLLIDRNSEVTQLRGIGMPEAMATAYADEDDALIATKVITKPPLATPLYQEDAGKIRVDSTRRLRRQRAISEDEELGMLLELEMPNDLAAAIVENDGLRLAKVTTTGG